MYLSPDFNIVPSGRHNPCLLIHYIHDVHLTCCYALYSFFSILFWYPRQRETTQRKKEERVVVRFSFASKAKNTTACPVDVTFNSILSFFFFLPTFFPRSPSSDSPYLCSFVLICITISLSNDVSRREMKWKSIVDSLSPFLNLRFSRLLDQISRKVFMRLVWRGWRAFPTPSPSCILLHCILSFSLQKEETTERKEILIPEELEERVLRTVQSQQHQMTNSGEERVCEFVSLFPSSLLSVLTPFFRSFVHSRYCSILLHFSHSFLRVSLPPIWKRNPYLNLCCLFPTFNLPHTLRSFLRKRAVTANFSWCHVFVYLPQNDSSNFRSFPILLYYFFPHSFIVFVCVTCWYVDTWKTGIQETRMDWDTKWKKDDSIRILGSVRTDDPDNCSQRRKWKRF